MEAARKARVARNTAIAVVLAGAAAWIAHLHVVAQSYHPVVRLAAPDGLVYTAVQEAKAERRACGEANNLFLGPLKQGCKDCEVLAARCERQLTGFEQAVLEGTEHRYPIVAGPGVRLAIEGPEPAALASCEQIAGQMVRNGLRSAACLPPQRS